MKSLQLPRRRPPPSIEVTLPLINVAFLLMAFFMLIGRTDATAPFEVQPPVASFGTVLPQGGVTISVSRAGMIALDGRSVGMPELLAALKDELAREPFFRINADASASLGAVLPVVSAVEAVGGARVVLVVTSSAKVP